MNFPRLFARKRAKPEVAKETPKPWPEQLWDASHCWHVAGATMYELTLACCSCDSSVILDCPDPSARLADGSEWRSFLRYSLMRGPQQMGVGRGFLLGTCNSGSRCLEADGYAHHSCSFVSDDPFMKRYGLEAEGLVRVPQ